MTTTPNMILIDGSPLISAGVPPVQVSGNAPTVGQTLIATSSTTATWQTGAGGGGGAPSGPAGGGLTGTYPNPGVAPLSLTGDAIGSTNSNTVTNLTGAAGVVTIPTADLAFGSNASTNALINAPNNTTILGARNAANSGDIAIIKIDGSNNIFVGSGTNDGYVILDAGTSDGVKVQVNSITTFDLTSNTLQFTNPSTQYNMMQPAAVSGAGQNLIILPQPPTTTGAAGSLVVNVSPPATGTVEAGILLQRGGTTVGSIQPQIGGTTSMAIYMDVTPSATNYALGSFTSGAQTALNGASNTTILVGGTNYINCGSSTVTLDQPTLTFASTLVPVITEVTAASDLATKVFSIKAQGAFATATTNVLGGTLNLASGVGSNGAATNNAGLVTLSAGSSVVQGIDGYGMFLEQNTIPLTNANVTLSAAQYVCPYIILTGTLTGSVTLTMPSNLASNNTRQWVFDFSQIVFATHTITWSVGTGAGGTPSVSALGTNADVITIYYPSANTLVGSVA